VSRSVSPPTSIISNLQVTESASAGLSYRWTPKITLNGSLQSSYSSSVATPVQTGAVLSVFQSSVRTYGGNANLNYAITPFLTANLSYQYTKSVQSSLTTNDSLILLALNFNPY
jgi:hypothetical protein